MIPQERGNLKRVRKSCLDITTDILMSPYKSKQHGQNQDVSTCYLAGVGHRNNECWPSPQMSLSLYSSRWWSTTVPVSKASGTSSYMFRRTSSHCVFVITFYISFWGHIGEHKLSSLSSQNLSVPSHPQSPLFSSHPPEKIVLMLLQDVWALHRLAFTGLWPWHDCKQKQKYSARGKSYGPSLSEV